MTKAAAAGADGGDNNEEETIEQPEMVAATVKRGDSLHQVLGNVDEDIEDDGEDGAGDEGENGNGDPKGGDDDGAGGDPDDKGEGKGKKGDEKDGDEGDDKDPITEAIPKVEPKKEEKPEEKPGDKPPEKTPEELKSELDQFKEANGIPDDVDFEGWGDAMKYMDGRAEKIAEAKYRDLKAADEAAAKTAKKTEAETEAADEEAKAEARRQTWNTEINQLVKVGELPEMKDRSDKDKGVQAVAGIFKWMGEHNAKVTEKEDFVTSVAVAHTMMKKEAADSAENAESEAEKAENTRKAKLINNGGANGQSKKVGAPTVRRGQSVHNVLSNIK